MHVNFQTFLFLQAVFDIIQILLIIFLATNTQIHARSDLYHSRLLFLEHCLLNHGVLLPSNIPLRLLDLDLQRLLIAGYPGVR